MGLYIHSPNCLHCAMLNEFNKGTILRFLLIIVAFDFIEFYVYLM
jgi:hypothetical protein